MAGLSALRKTSMATGGRGTYGDAVSFGPHRHDEKSPNCEVYVVNWKGVYGTVMGWGVIMTHMWVSFF